MRVLVGCERSGKVRQAFRDRGHLAWSCDIVPADDGSEYHIQDDVLLHLDSAPDGKPWDMGVFFPDCTYLAVSGSKWLWHPEDTKLPIDQRRVHPLYPNRHEDRRDAVLFVLKLMGEGFVENKIPKIAVENPIGHLSSVYRKPDQIIQPWQFGHGETKATCLWLKGLPKLTPTNIVDGREARIHKMPPGPNRRKDRSETYQGIANAMADQWGTLC